MLDVFSLGKHSYTINLNIEDQNLQNEEQKALEFIKSLRELYKDDESEEDSILHIPEKTLFLNGMFSFYDVNKAGKKIRRVARKLSD